MKIETMGLDVSIEKLEIGNHKIPSLVLKNEDEKINLKFETTYQGMEHMAEQIISALFDYDEDMAHRLYQEFGNVADLKEENRKLSEKMNNLLDDIMADEDN